jgi:GAF domain-containing protein
MPPEIEEVAKRRPDLVGLLGDVQPRSVMTVPLAAGGRVLGAMTFAFADSGRRYTRADLTLAEDLARRAAVAIENARLYELEREARREGEEARLRLQVLAEAGAAMAASLEVRPALASLTGAAARRICDYSLAYLLGPEGRIVDAVGAHRDPARFGSVERLALATLPDLDSEDDPVAGVLRTGEPMLVPDVTPELRDRVMAPGEQRALALELGFSSVIVAPLLARGRTLGALALVRAGDSPAFDEDDLSFATALAARGGLGVDNARLYAEREYVADTLQRSLLPPVLPEVAGLEVGARYVPASEGTQVGGDFYDVFGADGDHWIAVIGDVVGKGAQAAAMMGLARYTIRTAAIAEGRPSAILQTLNRGILSQTGEQRFCTACCVRLLRSGYGARMTVSVGGHPLPLVLHEDGSIDEVGTPGTVLGVFEDATLADQVVDLSHGDALVTFTDGVTDERDGGEEFGESRLNEVLFSLAGRSAQQIADGVLDAVLGFRTGEPKDDIAILVLKVVP